MADDDVPRRARRTAERASVADLSPGACDDPALIGLRVFGFRTEVVGSTGCRAPPTVVRSVAGSRRPAASDWVDPFVVVDDPADRAAARLLRRRPGDLPLALASLAGPPDRWRDPDLDGRRARRGRSLPHRRSGRARRRRGAVPLPRDRAADATRDGAPVRSGLAYFALRTGARIVPLVLGRTHDLYLHRRFRLEVLDPVTWQDLAGVARDTRPPSRGPRRSGALRTA